MSKSLDEKAEEWRNRELLEPYKYLIFDARYEKVREAGRVVSKAVVEQIFTSYNNPKGNAETERMMRTLKEELIWLKEWPSHHDAQEAVKGWIKNYNESYLHSAHGYRPPVWAEQNYKKREAA